MKNIKELIEQHKNEDGEINWEQANEDYNKHINDVVTAKTSKEVEKAQQEARATVEKDFIKELNIEADDISGVKAWAKNMAGNTDEIKERNIELEKKYKDLSKQHEEVNSKYNQVQSEYTTTQQVQKLIKKGVEPEQAEFLQYKLSKQVNEDTSFDDLIKEFEPEEEKPKTNNRFVKTKKGSGDDIDPAIKKRYSSYFGK